MKPSFVKIGQLQKKKSKKISKSLGPMGQEVKKKSKNFISPGTYGARSENKNSKKFLSPMAYAICMGQEVKKKIKKISKSQGLTHWGGRGAGTAFTKSCGMFHRICVPSLKGIRYDDHKLSKLQPYENLI